MTELNRPITKDDQLLINAVCEGQSLDFATAFMTRIPWVLKAIDAMGWVHDAVPEVELGEVEYYLVALKGEDGETRVVGGVGYLNRYEMNIEDPKDRKGVEVVTDEWDDISTFYTGWAFSEFDSYQEIQTWDFISAECVIAWKVMPKYSKA